MSTTKLPIVLGLLAVISAVPAWMPERSQATTTTEAATVLGTKVTPEQIGELRVAGWDDTLKSAQVIEVRKANGVWTIPSHFDFPADSNVRVTKVAAGFLGVERGRLVSDDPKDHGTLEVLDPLDAANLTKKGHGKRVTLKDQGGAVVLDLIIGKYVENGQSVYHVREAGSNAVYTAKVDPYELSTRFTDYVQTDPFKIEQADVRSLAVKDYSLDLQKGVVQQRSETLIDRADQDAAWESPQAPAGQKVKKDTVEAILGELSGLRLAGVRPYEKTWMAPCGFFPDANGNLYGTDGGLVVSTKQGVRYELYYGQSAAEADETAPPAAKAPGSDTAAAVADKPGTSRYLLLVVRYDPSEDADLKAVAAAGSDTVAASAAQKRADGNKAKAGKLQKRFLQYFYVINDDSFKKLRPALESLFENLPPEPMAGSTGKTNKQWLAEKAGSPGVLSTPSGLLYEVLSSGPADGKNPVDSDQVEVRYTGTLVDGTEFDSSKDGTATFGVTGVIKGWTEALKKMHPGDKWRVHIPPALAYGEAGSPPKIPANAILTFEMELVAIK